MMITDAAPNMRVALVRSNDKGRTWGPQVTISELGSISSIAIVTDPRDGALVRSGEIIPDFAADPRRSKNRVYAVWQDTRFNGISQIAFSRSDDGGLTWTAPARVNGDPDAQAFTPVVEVNRRGDVAISYYDFTYDTVGSEALETDFWVVRSRDGGRTFTPRRRMTPTSFDLRAAPNARGFFLGDYTGLAAAGNRFKALFGQTTRAASNPTDLFASTVGAGGRYHGKPPAGGWHPHPPAHPHRSAASPLRRR